jgi:hypothetical protein
MLLFAVLGCYGDDGPGPTPGTMDDVIGAIVLQGITVQHLVSGDAGCSTASLHEDAVHMTLVIGEQTALPYEVYFFNWNSQKKYDAAASDFSACMSEYLSHNPTVHLTELDAFPWRAYGPAWTPELYNKLAAALTSVDGTVSSSSSP